MLENILLAMGGVIFSICVLNVMARVVTRAIIKTLRESKERKQNGETKRQ